MDKKLFDKIEKEVGFGAAVVILETELPEDFFNDLPFDKLIDIAQNAPTKSETKKKVFTQMKQRAVSYPEWVAAYNCAYAGSEDEVFALGEVIEISKNLKEMYETSKKTAVSGHEILNETIWNKIRDYISALK